jgi:hypothetical protein
MASKAKKRKARASKRDRVARASHAVDHVLMSASGDGWMNLEWLAARADCSMRQVRNIVHADPDSYETRNTHDGLQVRLRSG